MLASDFASGNGLPTPDCLGVHPARRGHSALPPARRRHLDRRRGRQRDPGAAFSIVCHGSPARCPRLRLLSRAGDPGNSVRPAIRRARPRRLRIGEPRRDRSRLPGRHRYGARSCRGAPRRRQRHRAVRSSRRESGRRRGSCRHGGRRVEWVQRGPAGTSSAADPSGRLGGDGRRSRLRHRSLTADRRARHPAAAGSLAGGTAGNSSRTPDPLDRLGRRGRGGSTAGAGDVRGDRYLWHARRGVDIHRVQPVRAEHRLDDRARRRHRLRVVHRQPFPGGVGPGAPIPGARSRRRPRPPAEPSSSPG